ncbi:MAG: AMP-binding protein [Proteobacteria bacterium]|nr:AMP-binding protein [Pseudomonadota bacterium]
MSANTPAAQPLTLPRVLLHAADAFGAAPAVIEGRDRLDFVTFADRVRAVSAAFLAAGITPGDRVALWAPNSPSWLLAAFGAASVGAVAVPLSTRLKGREAAFILRRSGARVLVTVDEFLGIRYPQLLTDQALPKLELTLSLDTADWQRFLEAGAGVGRARVDAAWDQVAPDDIADMIFTSGTTGDPKGVLCTHAQNVRVFRTWGDVVRLARGDRYLIVNPFFHTFGYKAGALACLIQGATMYPVAVFDAAAVFDLVAREQISVLPGPPTLYQSLLSHPGLAAARLDSLRLAVTGAASVPPVLITRMRSELKFRSVLTAYGLTESTGVATICPHDADDETVATRCGLPIPGVEVRCADGQGRTVATGEAGEVLVRGYNVMRGYYQDAAATAAAIDAAGWLHTGDVGVLDERGYLRITDRIKDVYIVGGFNCYPAEIEKLLAEHPAVAQVAVIGVPDERQGEVGKACVVPRPGMHLDGETLIAWARGNMANYKVPRYVQILDALPVNAAGKVQKFALREAHQR